MSIISVCGLCVVSAVIILTIKKYNPEISLLISLAAGVIIGIMLINQVVPVISDIKELIRSANIKDEYTAVLFKSLGICFLCQFASDSCNDAGEKALASKIELAGRITVVILSVPLIKTIAETAIKLIQK